MYLILFHVVMLDTFEQIAHLQPLERGKKTAKYSMNSMHSLRSDVILSLPNKYLSLTQETRTTLSSLEQIDGWATRRTNTCENRSKFYPFLKQINDFKELKT